MTFFNNILNKAAKAGGFRSVGDMCKWIELQTAT